MGGLAAIFVISFLDVLIVVIWTIWGGGNRTSRIVVGVFYIAALCFS